MTIALSGTDVAKQIIAQFPESIVESNERAVTVGSDCLLEVAKYLKTRPELAFNYLADMTAADYFEYLELVYQLVSIQHNHSLVLKTRCYSRSQPEVFSVTGVWRGANFMEREIFDLLGIRFTGHPDLKRIFLWEGFAGYPLRKDYL
jgi:NADH-quinone oxidoreductase subunit C